MVLVLSLLPVSLRPLILVPKQVNYMLMFAAPLCLLGGWALDRMPTAWRPWAAAFILLPAVALALLQQASVLSFTANSRGTLAFAHGHPEALVFVGTQAQRAGAFEQLVRPATAVSNLRPMSDAMRDVDPAAPPRYAVFDPNTVQWASQETVRSGQDIPACWQRLHALPPGDLGRANDMLRQLHRRWDGMPQRLRALAIPAEAAVYRIPPVCSKPAAAVPR
jgi:hypothetical protein